MKTRVRFHLHTPLGVQQQEFAKREMTAVPRHLEMVRLGKLVYSVVWVCHIEDDGPPYVLIALEPETKFAAVLMPKEKPI